MRTAEVKTALRARFCAPEWAIFFEVADGTGSNQRRWADAVAMNMWPSRGLEIHGFEIKVSRSDWLRELKNPEKSSSVQKFCDRWWIITPKDIIKPGELPPTWGHYIISEAGIIRQAVDAPKLEAVPTTRAFMAAMLRRAGGVDEEEVRAAVRAEVEKQRETDQARVESEIKRRARQSTEQQDRIDTFEKASGLSLAGYGQPEAVGRAVRLVLDTGVMKTYNSINSLAREAQQFAERVQDAMKDLPVEVRDRL